MKATFHLNLVVERSPQISSEGLGIRFRDPEERARPYRPHSVVPPTLGA